MGVASVSLVLAALLSSQLALTTSVEADSGCDWPDLGCLDWESNLTALLPRPDAGLEAVPTFAGTPLLDLLGLDLTAPAWQYLVPGSSGDGSGSACEALPVYQGANISRWSEDPPAVLGALGAAAACSQLPVAAERSYIVGVAPFAYLAGLAEGSSGDGDGAHLGDSSSADGGGDSGGTAAGAAGLPLAKDLAGCMALNPCTQDYLFGFSGMPVKVPVPNPAGLPLQLALSLHSLSVSPAGQLSVSSGDLALWTLGGGGTGSGGAGSTQLGSSSVLEMPAHLALGGSGAATLGLELPDGTQVASISLEGNLSLAVNWDLEGDGNSGGNSDHAFLLRTAAAPKLRLLGALSVDLAGLGQASSLLYWRYVNATDLGLTVAMDQAVSLGALVQAVPLLGDRLAQFLVVDPSLEVAAGVFVDQERWALRLGLGADLGLNDEAVQQLQVANGTGISAELVLKGDQGGNVGVAFRLGDAVWDLQFCDSNDDCLEAGHHCFAFWCRPKQGRLGFCTADSHCRSGHCMDERAVLACGDCSQDTHCPEGSFCEVNPLQPRDLLGTCRVGLAGGQRCERDGACASGQCVGLFGASTGLLGKCSGCTDATCDAASYCDDALPVVSSQGCQPRKAGGAACLQGKQCASGDCSYSFWANPVSKTCR